MCGRPVCDHFGGFEKHFLRLVNFSRFENCHGRFKSVSAHGSTSHTDVHTLKSIQHAGELCEQAEVIANGERVLAATGFQALTARSSNRLLYQVLHHMHIMAIKPDQGVTC